MPELINWYLVCDSVLKPGKGGSLVETSRYTIHGNVYNSPRFGNGLQIYTSRVMNINREGSTLWIKTKNTLYECRLPMHLINQPMYEDLKEGLLEFGFRQEETDELMARMYDAYFPLDEEKKEKLQALIPEESRICNILEFSTDEEYYFRFMARKDESGIRFWDEESLLVHISSRQDVAEIHNDELEREGICFRFYPKKENCLELCGYPGEWGEVYVRNGGISPLRVETGNSSIVLAPGQCCPVSGF